MILAIDVGSTYLKCAVFEGEQMLEKKSRPMPSRLPAGEDARFEVDATAIAALAQEMIDDALMRFPGAEAIYLDSQMHGYVMTDLAGGEPSPYVSWQDRLAEPELSEIALRIGSEAIRRMGTRFKAGLCACSFFARHKGAPLGEDRLLHTLGGYLLYRLSGGTAHVCHESMAASLGLYDCEAHDWNRETQRRVGAERLMLPRVIPHTEAAGAYRGIPLYGDIGDHQASVYGLGEDTANSIILTLGTAGILCMPSNRPGQSEMEERPYFHGQSLLTKTRQPGGRTLDLLVRFVGDCAALVTGGPVEAQAVWEALQAGPPLDAAGLHITPEYFSGGGAGVIASIGAHNLTPQSLLAAGLDALAEAYEKAVQEFLEIEPKVSRLLLCGGRLTKWAYLQQALARRTGLSVVCPARQDEALYGLARLARERC